MGSDYKLENPDLLFLLQSFNLQKYGLFFSKLTIREGERERERDRGRETERQKERERDRKRERKGDRER